jgi:transcriptional regulator of acetoin/glycerol metabolism
MSAGSWSSSLTVSPIKDETGKVIAASKIARDIADQTREHDS